MKLEISATCDQGCVRPNNEDAVLVGTRLLRDEHWQGQLDSDEGTVLLVLAVADGMGGANAGEVASEMVLQGFRDGLLQLPAGLDDTTLKATLQALCMELHVLIQRRGLETPGLQGMGTTLTALVGYGQKLFLVHVGDSRAYRLRDGILSRLTRDHSLREMTNQTDAPSSVIMNSFGGGDSFFADVELAGQSVFSGDLFLLCSDGVSDLLDSDELEALAGQPTSPWAILDCAKAKGGLDNLSYVLAQVET
jgi:protein phosphatase